MILFTTDCLDSEHVTSMLTVAGKSYKRTEHSSKLSDGQWVREINWHIADLPLDRDDSRYHMLEHIYLFYKFHNEQTPLRIAVEDDWPNCVVGGCENKCYRSGEPDACYSHTLIRSVEATLKNWEGCGKDQHAKQCVAGLSGDIRGAMQI